jgi:hypothetical protein
MRPPLRLSTCLAMREKSATRYLATAVVFLLFVTSALAEIPPSPYIPPAPILNPSSPYVVPRARPVPLSPASGFSPGSYLAGTNHVVNPPRSVFHARHKHRLRHRKAKGDVGHRGTDGAEWGKAMCDADANANFMAQGGSKLPSRLR